MEEARLIDRSTLAPTRIVESYLYDAGWNLNRRTNNGVSSTFSVNILNEFTAGTCGDYATETGEKDPIHSSDPTHPMYPVPSLGSNPDKCYCNAIDGKAK